MKYFSSKRLTLSALSLLAVVTLNTPLAYAADSNAPGGVDLPLNCGTTDCLIAGYGTKVLKQMVKMPTDGTLTLNIQKLQQQLQQAKTTAANQPTPDSEKFSLKIEEVLKKVYLSDTSSDMLTANYLYAFDPAGGDMCANPKSGGGGGGISSGNDQGQGCKTPPINTLKNVSFSQFYDPVAYTEAQKATAQKFIQSTTYQGLPIKLADISKMLGNSDFNTFANNHETLKKYVSTLRQYATAQGTAMNNLMQDYNSRLPLGDKADNNLKKLLQDLHSADPNFPADPKQVSPRYLERYMATRRITNPNWYTTLTQDNPTMLQRQLVILQAENLAETYRLRMAIDRLNATMSVMMMQAAYNAQIQIQALRDQLTSEVQQEKANPNQ